MSPEQLVVVITTIEVLAAIVIGALAMNEVRYFRNLWHMSQDQRHPQRSYLLGSLLRLSGAIVVACAWFSVLLIIRLIWGPQWWTSPISATVIIVLLLQPRFIGQTLRRRHRSGIADDEDETESG